LELVDKSHKTKKNKKGRMQGLSPLPKKEASTTSIGIQKNHEELMLEETKFQKICNSCRNTRDG
jgi:hypothetical protein